MADIATLTVRITAALGDFQQSLDRLESTSEKALGKLETASQAANVALGTLATKGLTAVLSKLSQVGTDVLEFADQLGTLNARTGISIESLQELNFVANQASVPFESLTRAAELLGGKMAAGSDEMGRGLAAIGMSFKDIETLKPDEMLKRVFEQINQIANQGDKVAAVTAIFGKMGPELLPAIGRMDELTQAAHDLGVVIDEETIVAVGEFKNQTDALMLVVQAFVAKELPAWIEALGDLKTRIDEVKEAMGVWVTFQTDWSRLGAEHRVEILKLGLAYVQVARAVPLLGRAFELMTPSVVGIEESLREAEKALRDWGKKAEKLGKDPVQVSLGLEVAFDKDKLKVPTKEKEKAAKLIENDWSVWMRNRQPFGELFNIYPNRIVVDRTSIPKLAMGAGAEIEKWLKEELDKAFKERGMVLALHLAPPVITMAPADMTGINKYFDDIAEEAAEHAREAFGQQIGDAIGQGIAQAIEGASLPEIGRTIGGGIGGAIGEQIGKQIGASIGGVVGGIVGSIAGPVGTAVGALIGTAIGQALTRGEAAKEFDTLKRETFAAAGGFDALEKSARASARALSELNLAETSGNEEQLRRHMANLAEELQKLEFRANEVTDALSEISQQGGLVSPELMQQMREIRDFPGAAPKLFEFFQEQTQKAAAGLEAFVTNAKISSQAAATAATGAIGAIFADLQLQGATAGQALQALAPSIQALAAQLQTTGFTGTAAFQQLSTMAQYASDAVSGPLFTAISGIGDLLVGLSNTGALTQEMFTGLAGQVSATWQELVNMGKGGAAGMALIQKPLQRVWELTQDHGYAVDETTQKLLDEAVAAGIVGDEFRDSGDKMMAAVNELITRIGDLITTLTTTMVSGAQSGAREVQDALDGIETPTITIPIHFDMDDFPEIPHTDSPDVRAGASSGDLVLAVDGEVLARSNARHTQTVLAPYGV